MDKKEMMKKMIDLHRAAFDNYFSTLTMYQNQAEKNLMTFIGKTPGVNDEGRKVIEQWNEIYKRGIEDFKKAVDDGYTKIETLMDLDAMFVYQEQSEKMLDALIKQRNLVPHNYFKDVMDMWINMYNKNIANMEELFSTVSKKGAENKKKTSSK